MRALSSALVVLLLPLALACDRKIERYDPSEKPSQPDLAKIFPPGAERSEGAAPAAAAGGPPPAPGMPPGGAEEAESSTEPVRGRVVLDPSLAERVPPHATLFVIARRGNAGPPLAVKRVPEPTLPYEFEIGPDDRMIRQMPFAGPLQLSARLDSDGNATTRSAGDLQGSARGAANPGDAHVEIVIDQAL